MKRVVGLPGEDVEVKQGRLCLNGERVKEKRAIYPGCLDVGRGEICSQEISPLWVITGRFPRLPQSTQLSPKRTYWAK